MSRSPMPTLGPRGCLSYADRSAFLSERDAMIAATLIYNFEKPVNDLELLDPPFPKARPATRCACISHACNGALPGSV